MCAFSVAQRKILPVPPPPADPTLEWPAHHKQLAHAPHGNGRVLSPVIPCVPSVNIAALNAVKNAGQSIPATANPLFPARSTVIEPVGSFLCRQSVNRRKGHRYI